MDEKADPMLGRVLDGRYRIERRIARGGMAIVYEATDIRLDRVVAIKVMHEPLAEDPTFVSRFEREARSAAKLSHPNAVAVFDQGEDRGTLFLVMEYVPGVTLRDLIRREAPLPPWMALRVIESVLAALNAAHSIGIVHRDIKPENVLLATGDVDKMEPGRTKVADFGLARAINAETQHTATGGVIIGTVSYLAPEMLVNAAADARVDVYATGVLLYELLTGKKPHQADNPIQVAYKHVHEDIGKPSDEVRGIPPYLDALVARATARDVDQRPADAGVLLHHVRRVRQAIDAGVLDDPELTADLLPNAGAVGEDTAPAGIGGWGELLPMPDADHEPTARIGPVLPVAADPRPPTLRAARQKQIRRRRRVLAAVVVLVLALLLAFGGWYLLIARYTTTPGVLNDTLAVATQTLEGAGLHAVVSGEAYSENVPKGEVVSTSPAPGAQILKHGTVDLVLSRGPERHDVPKVVGLSQAAATTAITGASLMVGSVRTVYSDTIKPGIVISADPVAGTPLRRDSAVNLVVSNGPAPVNIPDFTGKPRASSVQALTALGLKVTILRRDYSMTVPADSIISQTPAGTTGHRGDKVVLVISKGKPLRPVPTDLRGKSQAAATAELQALGFNVAINEPLGAAPFGLVYSVSPGGGTEIPIGSTVTLNVV